MKGWSLSVLASLRPGNYEPILPPMRTLTVIAATLWLSTPAAAQKFPWNATDRPPSLAGLGLFEHPDSARKRLGTPIAGDTLGPGPDASVALTNATSGISVIATKASGVSVIYLLKREAGMLDSTRVGDSRDRVLARWGKPTEAQGNNALWGAGDWIVVILLGPDNSVQRLGVGRRG